MSNDSAIRGRLLVVDDEENQRQMLAGILERAGFEVVTAADGRQALVADRRWSVSSKARSTSY